jgi:universal stress protein E
VAIAGFVIGNTAENVLRELRCSLLALKPNGFVSPVRAY